MNHFINTIIGKDNYQYNIASLEKLVVDFHRLKEYIISDGAYETQITNLLKAAQLIVEEQDCLLYSERAVTIKIHSSFVRGNCILNLPVGNIINIVSLEFIDNLDQKIDVPKKNLDCHISNIDHQKLKLKGIPLYNKWVEITYMASAPSDEKLIMKIVQLTRDKIDSNFLHPI
jgi:hypothetical protein